MYQRSRSIPLLTVLPALLAGSAWGDVTLEQRLRIEGTGLLKMMNMSGDVVTTISGDRSRTESDMKMESRLMRMFGGGTTAEIVRLDDGTLYQLDLKKKTYTELSLAEQREAMQQSMEQMRESQQSQQQQAAGVDEESCEWSEPTATVDRRGETETIAGTRAERVVVTATQSCKDPQTEQVCSFNLILDQWLAPEFEAADEVTEYYRAYSEQLGLEVADAPGFSQRLESMFGGYQGIWSEIAEKMGETQGYPLRSTVSLAVGGPQCDTSQQAQAAEDSPGVREAVGGAVGGALGGLFGRQRDKAAKREAASEPVVDETLPEGTVKLMSIMSEITSISRADAPSDSFEVPENFRQVKR